MDLDLSGLKCPLLILQTKKFMKNRSSGDVVNVKVTDMDSEGDFAGYAATTRSEILEVIKTDHSIIYRIKKG